MPSLIEFFIANMPTSEMLLIWGVPFLCWGGGCLFLAGGLKRWLCWKTGYTRKVFHFLVFVSASIIQVIFGLQALCLFGITVSVWVLIAVVFGDGNMLYEALAREKDAPHRTFYIMIPYCATLIGGVLANTFFGAAAIAGYLVTGVADAIAEPVGTRWGKHTYRVPSLRSVKSFRSLEGSAAVLLACLPSLTLAIWAVSHSLEPKHALFIFATAGVCTLTEAVAPHGWDNALLQLVPSAVLLIYLGGVL